MGGARAIGKGSKPLLLVEWASGHSGLEGRGGLQLSVSLYTQALIIFSCGCESGYHGHQDVLESVCPCEPAAETQDLESEGVCASE